MVAAMEEKRVVEETAAGVKVEAAMVAQGEARALVRMADTGWGVVEKEAEARAAVRAAAKAEAARAEVVMGEAARLAGAAREALMTEAVAKVGNETADQVSEEEKVLKAPRTPHCCCRGSPPKALCCCLHPLGHHCELSKAGALGPQSPEAPWRWYCRSRDCTRRLELRRPSEHQRCWHWMGIGVRHHCSCRRLGRQGPGTAQAPTPGRRA